MSFVCVYILKKKTKQKKIKKKIQDFQNFPKKREKFSKKKIFGLGTLDFLVTFSKNAHFFLSKISRFFKVFFSKWYMRIPWTKHFLNPNV